MTFPDFASMTWPCEICGDVRPDASISVSKRPVEHDGRLVPGATRNTRYCNDRLECATAANDPTPYRIGAAGY